MESPLVLAAGAALALLGCASPDKASRGELASGSNRAFHHERATSASADAIWALWMDVSRWKEWDSGLKDARADAPLRLDVEGEIIPASGPASRFRVISFDEPRSYAFRTQLPLAELEVRRSIVAAAPATFRHDVSSSGPRAGLWSALLGPQFRRALPQSMDALAGLAEAKANAP